MEGMPPNPLSIAGTAVDLLALTTCIGALVCRLWLLPDTGIIPKTNARFLLKRLWRLIGICVVALTLSSVMLLFVRASTMSGRPITEVFSVLPLVIFKTHFGNVWMIRLIGLALAWLGWLWESRSFQSRTSLILMLAAGLRLRFCCC